MVAVLALTLPLGLQALGQPAVPRAQAGTAAASAPDRALLDRYCVTCHNDRLKTGGLTLAGLDPSHVETAPQVWEKVVRKLRASAMPPPNVARPDKTASDLLVGKLEAALD